MMQFTIRDVQANFFDRRKVIDKAEAAARRARSKLGAFTMTRARQSIRQAKSTADPGRPPHSHQGDLKKNIFFAEDFYRQSVVIGAVPFRASSRGPDLLEHGGIILVRRQRHGRPVEETWHYRGNPFMVPALAEALPKVPEVFKNSVRT